MKYMTCNDLMMCAAMYTQDTMHTVYNHYLEAHPQNMCSFFVFYRAKPAYIRSRQVCASKVIAPQTQCILPSYVSCGA
jgi:hypothetical protein